MNLKFALVLTTSGANDCIWDFFLSEHKTQTINRIIASCGKIYRLLDTHTRCRLTNFFLMLRGKDSPLNLVSPEMNVKKFISELYWLSFFLKPLKLPYRKNWFMFSYLIFLKELLSIVHHKIHYVITKHMEGHWPAKVTLHHLKYMPWNVPYISNYFFFKYWQLFLTLTCAVHIFDQFPRTNTSGH